MSPSELIKLRHEKTETIMANGSSFFLPLELIKLRHEKTETANRPLTTTFVFELIKLRHEKTET